MKWYIFYIIIFIITLEYAKEKQKQTNNEIKKNPP